MKYQAVVNLTINMNRPISLFIKLTILSQKDLDYLNNPLSIKVTESVI